MSASVPGGSKDKRVENKLDSVEESFVIRSPLLETVAKQKRELRLDGLNPV